MLSWWISDSFAKCVGRRTGLVSVFFYVVLTSRDDGLTVSPLVNTDRKGGAFPIMLQQFRRAIGVAIVSGHAKHKLRILHYVRATAAEAARIQCKSQ